MWLATKLGFYSIVQKERSFHIRSRLRKDLENLIIASSIEESIKIWPGADYRFRIIIEASQLNKVFQVLFHSIDYENFKDMILHTDDQKSKSQAYSSIWDTMYKLQE